jgi:hypothetical protein
MALAACLLWLSGVEVLPAIHEGMHDRIAPHRHDNGSIVVVSFEDTTHRHPDGSIHFVAPRSRTAAKLSRDSRTGAADATHHADGLAHHAAALAPTPPPITRPLPIDRRPSALALERSVELVACDAVAATARGPPLHV